MAQMAPRSGVEGCRRWACRCTWSTARTSCSATTTRPANKDPVAGATRGVVGSCLMLLEQGATHVAVATDHVIESFRNDLWAGYKDGSGIDRDAQGAVPGRRGRPARGGVPRVGDGRAGGRRRPGRRRRGGGRRRPRRAGGDLHARQGPRPVRGRQGLAVGPASGQVVRRRRRAGAPRRAAGADPRPPGPRGRRRRRVPRPARLGRQVGRRRSSIGGATSRTSPSIRSPGTPASAARPS